MSKGEQISQDLVSPAWLFHKTVLFFVVRWDHLSRSVYEGLIEQSCLFKGSFLSYSRVLGGNPTRDAV